jgi:hypothetical protein
MKLSAHIGLLLRLIWIVLQLQLGFQPLLPFFSKPEIASTHVSTVN